MSEEEIKCLNCFAEVDSLVQSWKVGLRSGYYQWIKVSHPSAPPRFKAWRAKATLMGCIY